MRVIRCKQSLTVTLSGGRIIQTNECTDELFEQVKALHEADNEFEMINLLIPEKEEESINNVRLIKFWKNAEASSEITKEGNSVYWNSVSPLSMPMSFAEKVMKAESTGDTVKLEAYRNFWTLLSLNQDAVVRENLFKFLDKWGMCITKSGLVVGYRNADVYRESSNPSEGTIYTDHHSGTTRIMIGRMVTLDRSKCDCDSSVECSRGLHIGGTSWLEQHYYGDVGLVCLVNPIDIIAVPWRSAEYGKLRCCAYLPIATAKYDNNGHIIPFRTDSGFEEPFVPTILYDGVMATEDDATYKIPIPEGLISNAALSQKSVSDNILSIARQYMQDKE